ncbi:MAG: Bug family tripartite tricarboxylate transporter substrate binding protein [Beijerinckiaceae bacterium]
MKYRATIAALPALLLAGAFAQASAESYFHGRTITVEVPAGSGGTYHIYCQIVQNRLAKYIPGHPTMIIKNRPGAGGAGSATFMSEVAPKDGTHIAMISPGVITVPLFRKVTFDARKFEFLGSLAARSSAVWIWHTKGVTTLDQLKKTPVKIASSGYAAAGSVFPRLINRVLATKMELIYGYKGGGTLNLSMERGETEGRWNYRSGFAGVRPDWIPKKKVVPVLATGPRDPEFKGVPHMRDLLKEGSVEQKLYDLIGMNFEVGQAFYAPPGTPVDVMKILRTAFERMIADPETKKEVKGRNVDFSPKTAKQIRDEMDRGFKGATPDVVAALREVYTKRKK